MPKKHKPSGDSLRIDIRDKRIPGGRLNISAGTTKAAVRNSRQAAVVELIDLGLFGAIEQLRSRKLHITSAVTFLRTKNYAALRNGDAPSHVPTLGKITDQVLKTVKATRTLGTYRQYVLVRDCLIDHGWEAGRAWDFGPNTPLDFIMPEMAADFLHGMKTKGKPWAPATQKQVRIVCNRFWTAAKLESPFKDVQLPKQRARRPTFLQPAEWRHLFDSVVGTPDAAVMALGCLAGLRIGEVAHLRTDIDVDLVAGRLHVQPRGGEYAWTPKHDNSVRTLKIGSELLPVLQAHAAYGYHGQRYFIRIAKPIYERPVSEAYLEDRTEACFTKAGIQYGRDKDGLTNHSLRHTFGSWLAQQDTQLLKIARLMGNTPDVVARFYAHLTPDDLDRAIDTIDRVASA